MSLLICLTVFTCCNFNNLDHAYLHCKTAMETYKHLHFNNFIITMGIDFAEADKKKNEISKF